LALQVVRAADGSGAVRRMSCTCASTAKPRCSNGTVFIRSFQRT
jgi:hypothetical protein